MISGAAVPELGPIPDGGTSDGDPVDLGTGQFVFEKTDLEVADVMPIEIKRTHVSQINSTFPSLSFSFGVNGMLSYDMRLWSNDNFKKADLILPTGGRVHYVRTSPGTGYADAIYEATGTPGEFLGSTMVWNGNGWDLRLKDGTTYVFGNVAPLQAIRDRFGNQVTLTRAQGQSGNITRITSPNGRWVRLTYDGSSRITEVRDNGGRRVSYTYDTEGLIDTVTDVAGGVTTYKANARGISEITDPRGITFIKNSWDQSGRVASQYLADGGTYQFGYPEYDGYDCSGGGKKYKCPTQTRLARVTDPRGAIREVSLSANGFVESETVAVGEPAERTTSIDRDASSGRVASVTDPLGRVTEFDYDANGNVAELTKLAGTPAAVSAEFSYEPVYNQLESFTDALGHSLKLDYDSVGQLMTVTDASGREQTYGYAKPNGQPTSITDPADKTTKLTYDDGLLASVEDPLGNETRAFADTVGRPAVITDPLGRQTRYDYDDANNLRRITAPDGGETNIDYDANANPTKVTDARGGVFKATYDDMDRVATQTDPLARVSEYEYDLNGNLTKATDRKGQVTTYTYDALNRRVFAGFGTTGTPGSEQYESTVEYAWDDAGRLLEADDSVSGTFNLAWTALDQLSSETGPTGSVGYTYDDAGRRTAMTVPDQATTTYGYDNANRLTNLTRGGLTVDLTYDAAGRRDTVTLPNDIVQDRTYDDASRLTGIEYAHGQTAVGDLHYAYDNSGQRTAMWGTLARTGFPEPMASAIYDAANRRTSQDSSPLDYDFNGNLTDDGDTTYTWDARDHLSSLDGSQTDYDFTYDPFGRRASRFDGTSEDTYLHDGWNVVQEQIDGDSVADVLAGLSMDDVLARTTASGTESVLTDALGSTLSLTDVFGLEATAYTYGPFGETTTTGPHSANPYQYTGRENDGTGLYSYRARYFSPQLKRFISEDPIGLAAGDTNLQAYVGNSPTNYVDPTGLIDITPGFVDDAYDAFTDQAQSSMEFYADVANGSDSPFLDVAGYVGGSLSSLGTRKNAPKTAAVLSLGFGGGGVIGGVRYSIQRHAAHHPFRIIGRQPHLQFLRYKQGVKGSGKRIQVPYRFW